MIGKIGNYTVSAKTNNSLAKTGFGRTYVKPENFGDVEEMSAINLDNAKEYYNKNSTVADDKKKKLEMINRLSERTSFFLRHEKAVKDLRKEASKIDNYLKNPEDAKADAATLRANANKLNKILSPFREGYRGIQGNIKELQKEVDAK